MPRVDRVTADEWDQPGWSAPSPRVAVAWVAVLAALIGTAAYFGLRPDAWDMYQKDFGCTALTNIDSTYARSRCKAPDTVDRSRAAANGPQAQAAAHAQSPRGAEAR